MRLLTPFLLLLLSGCAATEQIASQLPTARYCSEVAYSRQGHAVEFYAKCTAPFGGM